VKDRITLGLLLSQIDSGYAKLLIAGASNWVRENGANLTIFSGRALNSPYGYDYQNNVIFDSIKPGTVDALIMATGTQCNYQTVSQFRTYTKRFGGIPAVSIAIKMDGIPNVLVDNKAGVSQAIEHFVAVHGFTRIAFLKGPRENEEAESRFMAYREAVAARGLEDDPELNIQADFTTEGARLAISEYLKKNGRPDFQAILAANDEMAIAAAKILTEHGFAIPRDVAIIGFDNTRNSQFIVPPMTTIEQPLFEQARTAADFASRLINGEPLPETVVLPTRLVLRTSCGCLPRHVAELDGLATLPPASARKKAVQDTRAIIERCFIRLSEKEFTLPDRALRDILEALITLSGTPDGFIGYLHSALCDEILRKVDISAWQVLLTVLHEEFASTSTSAKKLSALAVSFQKARTLLAEMLRLEQGKGLIDLQVHVASLRRIMERLSSAATIEELMRDLPEELDLLDIRTCFIAGYSPEVHHERGDQWRVPAHAHVMLCFVDGKSVELSDADRVFSPAKSLIPTGLLPKDRPYVLVATSLFFREDQIGYLVYEPGERDPAIYETFRVQLGNILKGSTLIMARHKAEERLRQVLAELEEYNQKLSGLSQTDELTGLLNRRGFLSLGRQNLTLARRMGRRGNVFFTDLDDLKKINDSLGHQEGDAVIKAAAEILKKTFRNVDILARLGGDEFVVLTIDTVPDFVESLKQRLEASISTYNADSGKPYKLCMSLGAVPFERESTVSLEELLDRADDVLYAEKKRKKKD
jgi:diguanylate cyclase (GGDEF)-like protein